MIPLARDTRESLGPFAERVENRSLLFQKMVLSKSALHEARFDDAAKFNVLRATFEGGKVLQEEQSAALAKKNQTDQLRYKAKVAGALSSINVDNQVLAESRIQATNRFQLALAQSYQDRIVNFSAKLGGRLLINMAGGVMENSGLALDRTTGLPFIPGSSVKGVARHAALWDIRNSNHSTEKVSIMRVALAVFCFGPQELKVNGDFLWAANGDTSLLNKALQGFDTDTYKGICSFLPASPSSIVSLKVVAEVLTPHFNNNLRPIFFPAVESGSEFAFSILGQRTPHLEDLDRPKLLEYAKKWLLSALTQNGIGAKTGAGYGWFEFDPQAEADRQAELEREKQRIAEEQAAAEKRAEEQRLIAEAEKAERERKAQLNPEDRAYEEIQSYNDPEFAEFAKDLADKDPDQQRAFFKVLLSSAKKDRRKQWKKKKKELWAALGEVATSLKIELE